MPNFTCSKCGQQSSSHESPEHAKDLALNEGFIFRPPFKGGQIILCPDCGSVKAMKTTSSEYVTKKRTADIKMDKKPIADRE